MSNKNENHFINYKKSTFTLTFVIELLDALDTGTPIDYNQECIELGPISQALKLQYELYLGKNFDLDIWIWPQVAKISCGAQIGWVRAWPFLERRWIAFSISHAFSVRVKDVIDNLLTISISSAGTNLKQDKIYTIHLPPLKFGQTRYFAPVIEGEPTIQNYIQDLFWLPVQESIPESYLDGLFDCPSVVSDVRHQEAAIFQVRELILNKNRKESTENVNQTRLFENDSKTAKDKTVKGEMKTKYGLNLKGKELLAGIGKVILFNAVGDRTSELGETIVCISSKELPASDDLPLFFVNIDKLFEIPVDDLNKCRVINIYTRWRFGKEVHESKYASVNKIVDFHDHYPVLLPIKEGSKWLSKYVTNNFEIELRCIRTTKSKDNPKLFGYDFNDANFGKGILTVENIETDVPFAICKVDIKSILRNNFGSISGGFPIYPINYSKSVKTRAVYNCTNDINDIKEEYIPEEAIFSALILEAQMSLEVSLGLVGCKLPKIILGFSRLYSIIEVTDLAEAVLQAIKHINEDGIKRGLRDELLTGWMIDIGDCVLLYLESQNECDVFSVYNLIENSKNKSKYLALNRLESRLYDVFLNTPEPFLVLKMFVPLNTILSCPPIYANAALPSPTKDVVMKLNRLHSGSLETVPCNGEMPTVSELRSLQLELCSSEQPVTGAFTTK